MKVCGRCDQPIRANEEHTRYDIPGASHAGATVYRHTAPCPRVPIQTAPVPVRH